MRGWGLCAVVVMGCVPAEVPTVPPPPLGTTQASRNRPAYCAERVELLEQPGDVEYREELWFNDWRELIASTRFDQDGQIVATSHVERDGERRSELHEFPVGSYAFEVLQPNEEMVRKAYDGTGDGIPESTLETVAWSPAGDPIERVEDGSGGRERTFTTYDESRRKVTNRAIRGDDGPLLWQASYEYHETWAERRVDFDADDRWDSRTHWTYDDAGHIVEEHEQSEFTNTLVLTTWEDDRIVEQRKRTIDGWQLASTFTWDAWGRPIEERHEQSNGTPASLVRWTYRDCPELE